MEDKNLIILAAQRTANRTGQPQVVHTTNLAEHYGWCSEHAWRQQSGFTSCRAVKTVKPERAKRAKA